MTLCVFRAAVIAAAFLAGTPLFAGELTIEVVDQDERPVKDAVANLSNADGSIISPVAAEQVPPSVIDQRSETFVPLVTIVPKGGAVKFKNSDRTRHHVYSFSAVKPFEFVLNPGQESPPVVIPQVGVAAIGCNIHDRMVAYVYVSPTPWTALSSADGKASIPDVPAGSYQLKIWHPRLKPGYEAPLIPVAVADKAVLRIVVPLVPERPHSGHRREY